MTYRLPRRRLFATAGALAAPLLWPAASRAQATWPDRPIRLVVPFGAGGAIDTLSRTVAARFAEVSGGQTLVVENRAGAGGTIAGLAVARERPDGLTLMMADIGANAIGKELNPNLAYDPPTAFTPIIHLVSLPAVLMAHTSVTANTVQELRRTSWKESICMAGPYCRRSAGDSSVKRTSVPSICR